MRISDWSSDVCSSDLMMDRVGNKSAAAEIAMIKVQAPNMALKIIDDAIQAHGGGGVSEDFGLAKRSEEHTSELQSLMRISYAVFCLQKKNQCNYTSHPI